jgi:hypothetical protein
LSIIPFPPGARWRTAIRDSGFMPAAPTVFRAATLDAIHVRRSGLPGLKK